MVKKMGKAYLFGQIMNHTKECGLMTTNKGKENLFLETEEYLKEILKINKQMVSENY